MDWIEQQFGVKASQDPNEVQKIADAVAKAMPTVNPANTAMQQPEMHTPQPHEINVKPVDITPPQGDAMGKIGFLGNILKAIF